MDLRKEKEDEFKASTFTFKIVCFKADKCARPQEIPRKLTFQMRFFTFREIALPDCSLFRPGMNSDAMEIETGEKYYL